MASPAGREQAFSGVEVFDLVVDCGIVVMAVAAAVEMAEAVAEGSFVVEAVAEVVIEKRCLGEMAVDTVEAEAVVVAAVEMAIDLVSNSEVSGVCTVVACRAVMHFHCSEVLVEPSMEAFQKLAFHVVVVVVHRIDSSEAKDLLQIETCPVMMALVVEEGERLSLVDMADVWVAAEYHSEEEGEVEVEAGVAVVFSVAAVASPLPVALSKICLPALTRIQQRWICPMLLSNVPNSDDIPDRHHPHVVLVLLSCLH